MACLLGLRDVLSKQLRAPLRPRSIATATAATTSNQTTLAITIPSSRASGDLLVVFGETTSTTATLSAPAGWDARLTDSGRLIATRTSDGTEGSTTFTSSASTGIKLVAAVIRDGLYDTVGTLSAGGTTTTAAAITLAQNRSIVFGFFSVPTGNVSISIDSNQASLIYETNITTSAPSIRIYAKGYKTNAFLVGSLTLMASGSSGTIAATTSSGTLRGVLMSVKPKFTG